MICVTIERLSGTKYVPRLNVYLHHLHTRVHSEKELANKTSLYLDIVHSSDQVMVVSRDRWSLHASGITVCTYRNVHYSTYVFVFADVFYLCSYVSAYVCTL